MKSIVKILEYKFPDVDGVHPSTCKLVLAWIWMNNGQPFKYVDIVDQLQMSDRGVHRAMKVLKDHKLIELGDTDDYVPAGMFDS
ncbi:unnamed protein product [marine sediment metagenome]|uniref:Uncharacterized protein n=1 Tax=marine sediment metagenome TaxID=412755 RepID=X0Y8W6_9ZZZZ